MNRPWEGKGVGVDTRAALLKVVPHQIICDFAPVCVNFGHKTKIFSSKNQIFRQKSRFFVEKTDFFVIPLANRAGALRTPPNARLLFFVSRDESSVGADLESKMSDLKFRPKIAHFGRSCRKNPKTAPR